MFGVVVVVEFDFFVDIIVCDFDYFCSYNVVWLIWVVVLCLCNVFFGMM